MHLLLGGHGVGLGVEHVVARDDGLRGRTGEVEVRERAGDVRVRLGTEVGARIAGRLLLLVGVVEQVDEGWTAVS